MNIELILLEEFRTTPPERRTHAGESSASKAELRKWVLKNLRNQLGKGGQEVEKIPGSSAVR